MAFFSFFLSPNQKAFHSDIASVIRQRLQEEEALLEDQRPTLQAMSHYVEVSTPLLLMYFLETQTLINFVGKPVFPQDKSRVD